MTLRHTLLLAVLLFALPYRVVTAHHAFSPVYDGSKTVTIVGTLTDFRLVNPHAMMTVDVVDNDPKGSAAKGILALQIHAGPAMVVEFKNIRLKQYDTGKDGAGKKE